MFKITFYGTEEDPIKNNGLMKGKHDYDCRRFPPNAYAFML